MHVEVTKMVQHFEKETGTLYDMEDEGDSMLWLFGRIFVFVTTACWIMLKFGHKLGFLFCNFFHPKIHYGHCIIINRRNSIT